MLQPQMKKKTQMKKKLYEEKNHKWRKKTNEEKKHKWRKTTNEEKNTNEEKFIYREIVRPIKRTPHNKHWIEISRDY